MFLKELINLFTNIKKEHWIASIKKKIIQQISMRSFY